MRVTPKEYKWIRDLELKCHLPSGEFWEAEWVSRLRSRFGCTVGVSYSIEIVNRDSEYEMPRIVRFPRESK